MGLVGHPGIATQEIKSKRKIKIRNGTKSKMKSRSKIVTPLNLHRALNLLPTLNPPHNHSLSFADAAADVRRRDAPRRNLRKSNVLADSYTARQNFLKTMEAVLLTLTRLDSNSVAV
jgi:hypothetical protein